MKVFGKKKQKQQGNIFKGARKFPRGNFPEDWACQGAAARQSRGLIAAAA